MPRTRPQTTQTAEEYAASIKPSETVSTLSKEHWFSRQWRPAMAWIYALICVCDFVLFPIGYAIILAVTDQPIKQWTPITLEGAGLIHLAFGAVLGITSYGRTKEKLNRNSD